MNNRKKTILLLYAYLIILLSPKSTNKKSIDINNNYTFHSTIPYASYEDKNIYISNQYTIKNILNDNDIFIIDSRYSKDPDILVYNSYKIKNVEDIYQILNILKEYEKQYPSRWNRTIESMKNEWIIHNLSYLFNYNVERSKSVDLNNQDETTYNSKLLSLFIK